MNAEPAPEIITSQFEQTDNLLPMANILEPDADNSEMHGPDDEPAVENLTLGAEESTPTTTLEDPSAVDAGEFKAQISFLQGELENVQTSLTEEIQDRDRTIEELQGIIQSMKEEMSTLDTQRAQTSPAPAVQKTVSETPKPSDAYSPPPPVAQQKPQQAPVKSSVKWVMRSAQPGKALVSKEGADGVYAIEVGGSLAGLGQITTIAQENGKWVVRGTKGYITQ